MNTNLPDSFYLVCVDKPGAGDAIESKWQAWQRFSKKIEEIQKQPSKCETLSENLFLFDSRKNVMTLNWILDLCKKEGISTKVFFLPQKPELCE